jgi:hypothetical protein
LATLLAATATICRADVIYDNVGQTSAGGDSVNPGGLVRGPLYNSFSTGSGTGVLLTDIQLLLSTTGAPVGSTSIGIYNSDGSASPPIPGSLLATIGTVSDASLGGTASVWSVSLGSPLSLAAGTRYWVGLSTSNNANAQWSYASSSAGTGVAGEYLSNNTGTFSTVGNGPYQMTVSVAAVPEPSLTVMALVGLACSGVAIRRRPCTVGMALRRGSPPA